VEISNLTAKNILKNEFIEFFSTELAKATVDVFSSSEMLEYIKKCSKIDVEPVELLIWTTNWRMHKSYQEKLDVLLQDFSFGG